MDNKNANSIVDKCIMNIINAARTLIENESDRFCLLQNKGMERSIELVFGYYIKSLINLKEIDVDCEYNKNMDIPKMVGRECANCLCEKSCYYKKVR